MLGVIVLTFSVKGRFVYVDCFKWMRLRAGSMADIDFVLPTIAPACCQNVKTGSQNSNGRNGRKDKFKYLVFNITHLKAAYYIVIIIGCQVSCITVTNSLTISLIDKHNIKW